MEPDWLTEHLSLLPEDRVRILDRADLAALGSEQLGVSSDRRVCSAGHDFQHVPLRVLRGRPLSRHWRGDSLVRFVVCADPRDYVSLGFVVRVRKHRIERIAGISSFVPFVAKLPAKRRALRVRVGG